MTVFHCSLCCICMYRLSALVTLVSEGLQMEQCSEGERVNFGERLKTAIASFTVDFLPHMREEEEVGTNCIVLYIHMCRCLVKR